MSKTTTAATVGLPILGTAMVVAIQTPPDVAKSNAAKWVGEVIGVLPDWPAWADWLGTIIGLLLVVVPILLWLRRKQSAYWSPKAVNGLEKVLSSQSAETPVGAVVYPPTVRRSKGDRDTTLVSALGYAMHGDWEKSVPNAITSSLVAALGRKGVKSIERPLVRFRAAAEANELRVWGRRGTEGLFELIHPTFWETNVIDPEPLISLLPEARTVHIGKGDRPDQYYDIMVNKAEVEKVWPHAG